MRGEGRQIEKFDWIEGGGDLSLCQLQEWPKIISLGPFNDADMVDLSNIVNYLFCQSSVYKSFFLGWAVVATSSLCVYPLGRKYIFLSLHFISYPEFIFRKYEFIIPRESLIQFKTENLRLKLNYLIIYLFKLLL